MDKNTSDIIAKMNQEFSALLKAKGGALNTEQMAWLAGYCSGLADAGKNVLQAMGGSGAVTGSMGTGGKTDQAAAGITLLFSSHSGNGKALSRRFKTAADAVGLAVRMQDMATFKPRDLKHEKNLLVIISTHGEGVPPSSAESLFEFLNGNRAPNLAGLSYSVLALGDKAYVHYCKAGIDLDQRLEALGAKRLFERVDCDVDFEEPAGRWVSGVLEELKKTVALSGATAQSGAVSVGAVSGQLSADAPAYSPKNPFYATVLSKINLNGQGSEKETYHIELSIEGSGISYQPGDSCGLLPLNSDKFIGEVLAKLNLDPSHVFADREGKTLAEVLKGYELTVLTPDVLKKHNAFANSEALGRTIADVAHLREYIYGRDFLDLWQEYPVRYAPADLLAVLRPIPARLYSITSSPLTYQDELHLLVSVVRYNAFGRDKEGVASTFWADRILENEKVPIYVKSNEAFRLPSENHVPVIMVGPGAGVAPFRAFVEERAALGHTGKSWLFFGNPHFTTDFFYQTEWQEHLKNNLLTRLDVAFSRDQKDKVYVQHKIIQNAKDICAWIKDGAYIYVCGDTKRMAPDVFGAFVDVMEKEDGLSREEAQAFLKDLKRSGRYLEDVY